MEHALTLQITVSFYINYFDLFIQLQNKQIKKTDRDIREQHNS